MNQFASTLINGPGSPAVKSASPATPAHDETMVSSTEDRDWRNATPVRQRNTSVWVSLDVSVANALNIATVKVAAMENNGIIF